MYIQSKVFTKLHVQAIDTIAGCHSIVLLIVLDSTINKRLVFFSSAVRSGIFTGVTEYGFCTSVHTIDVIAEEADRSLFAKIAGSQNCLHTLFPDTVVVIDQKDMPTNYLNVVVIYTRNHLFQGACLDIVNILLY